jgi:hypothetical protein
VPLAPRSPNTSNPWRSGRRGLQSRPPTLSCLLLLTPTPLCHLLPPRHLLGTCECSEIPPPPSTAVLYRPDPHARLPRRPQAHLVQRPITQVPVEPPLLDRLSRLPLPQTHPQLVWPKKSKSFPRRRPSRARPTPSTRTSSSRRSAPTPSRASPTPRRRSSRSASLWVLCHWSHHLLLILTTPCRSCSKYGPNQLKPPEKPSVSPAPLRSGVQLPEGPTAGSWRLSRSRPVR